MNIYIYIYIYLFIYLFICLFIYNISLSPSVLEWNTFQTNFVEKIKIHLLSITFFENRAVYEIICKNIVERSRQQMTIWRICIACWITKSTNKHSQILTLFVFHCNNGCKNAPQCYLLRVLFVSYVLNSHSVWHDSAKKHSACI